MMKKLQKLGSALMLPVAVLPICGILMGLGYLLCPAYMMGGDWAASLGHATSGLAHSIGYVMIKAGGALIDNMDTFSREQELKMLNGIKERLLCVRGNCDTEVDQMVLDFPVLADYAILAVGERMIYATHGHKHGKDNPPPLMEGDYLFCGHTHIPTVEDCGRYTYVNCGSVSIPKSGSANSYMLLEGNVCQWQSLDGEIYHTETL